MRTIRIFASYYCWPNWESDGEQYNVDPETLPISKELKERLMEWERIYDETLDENYPPDSRFPTVEDGENWEEEGHAIVRQLQEELGTEFKVLDEIDPSRH